MWLSSLLPCQKDKSGLRAKKCVFIGFKKGMKGYKILDPKDKKIIFVGCQKFTEDKGSKHEPPTKREGRVSTLNADFMFLH